MPLFRKQKTSVEKTEPFITLIRVAQEDPEIRQQLLAILSQSSFNRTSILNSYIEDLRLKQAPEEFTVAIACLLDDDIAQKALDILKEKDQE
jgi:hypothetical protein